MASETKIAYANFIPSDAKGIKEDDVGHQSFILISNPALTVHDDVEVSALGLLFRQFSDDNIVNRISTVYFCPMLRGTKRGKRPCSCVRR